MSWLTLVTQVKGVRDRLVEELPHIKPLLEALEANDYVAAAAVVESYGSFQDVLNQAQIQADKIKAEVLAQVPDEMRPVVEAALSTLPTDIKALVLSGVPSLMKVLDDLLPEEKVIQLLKTVGVWK